MTPHKGDRPLLLDTSSRVRDYAPLSVRYREESLSTSHIDKSIESLCESVSIFSSTREDKTV